jgi:hypothetical protein
MTWLVGRIFPTFSLTSANVKDCEKVDKVRQVCYNLHNTGAHMRRWLYKTIKLLARSLRLCVLAVRNGKAMSSTTLEVAAKHVI